MSEKTLALSQEPEVSSVTRNMQNGSHPAFFGQGGLCRTAVLQKDGSQDKNIASFATRIPVSAVFNPCAYF